MSAYANHLRAFLQNALMKAGSRRDVYYLGETHISETDEMSVRIEWKKSRSMLSVGYTTALYLNDGVRVITDVFIYLSDGGSDEADQPGRLLGVTTMIQFDDGTEVDMDYFFAYDSLPGERLPEVTEEHLHVGEDGVRFFDHAHHGELRSDLLCDSRAYVRVAEDCVEPAFDKDVAGCYVGSLYTFRRELGSLLRTYRGRVVTDRGWLAGRMIRVFWRVVFAYNRWRKLTVARAYSPGRLKQQGYFDC